MAPSLQARPAAPAGDPLAALRAEIDAVDDALHDLLMRRAAVVARLAASRVKGATASPLRPGREAAILRRLLARHSGPLPAIALVRLWREILCASSAMQGAFSIAVPARNAALAEAARTHFGTLAALRFEPDAASALDPLAHGGAQAAVLPMPATDGAGAWWTDLRTPDVQVVALLPFYAAADAQQALVLSRAGPDPSGDDRTLLRFAFDAGAELPEPDDDTLAEPMVEAIDPWEPATRAPLLGLLRAAGLPPRTLLLSRKDGRAWALADVEGALTASDPRLAAIRARATALDAVEPLGFYATPVRAPTAATPGE